MDIYGLNKQRTDRYLSFEEYASKTKMRYNKKLFKEEEMYFCKIWKAHRQSYIRLCEHNNWASDVTKLNDRLYAYESKLNNKYDY